MIATLLAASDATNVAAGVASASLRALVVAGIAVAIGERLAAAFRRLPAGRLRLAAALLCALPFVMPALVVGYAYSDLALSLRRWPVLLEGWYSAVLIARFVPVALLVLYLAPAPPQSPSAAFCRRLLPCDAPLRQLGIAQQVRLLLLGPWRNRLVAAAAVFVAAFPEFEVAALSSIGSWTVTLFRAHAGGLEWRGSLGLATMPALVQLLALGLGVLVVRSFRDTAVRSASRDRAPAKAGAGFFCYLVVAAGLGALVPLALVTGEGANARQLPWAQLATEIGWSLWFAVPAVACAWWFAGRIVLRPARRWFWCLPGLCGALVLGLLLLGLFQLPLADRLGDTPVPLLVALVLLLLPLAVLLRSGLDGRNAPGVHLATLQAQSGARPQRRAAARLGWQLRGRPRALLAGVLLFVGLFEVVATGLLHPVTMTPAAVRLYNLMHYGHGAVLSGMVLAMVLAGLVLMALVVWVPGVLWGWSLARAGGRRG